MKPVRIKLTRATMVDVRAITDQEPNMQPVDKDEVLDLHPDSADALLFSSAGVVTTEDVTEAEDETVPEKPLKKAAKK